MQKSYWLYYVISFLRGCRRHMFSTFAIFLLVANYHLKIEYTALLFLVTSAVSIVTNKQLGNLTERVGERFLLASTSFLLIFIFVGYAYVMSIYVLLAFFIADSILFGSSVALNSYIRKIAPKRDLTNALSIGLTMNHVAAVVIPIAGGVMWDTLGFRVTFIMGAVIVLADACFSLLVKPPLQAVVVAKEIAGVERL
jgi:MFS family permease